jgi:hypothetical protein
MNRGVSLAIAAAAASAIAVAGQTALAGAVPNNVSQNQFFAGYTAESGDIGVQVHSVTTNWIEPRVIPHGYRNAYAAFYTGFEDFNNTGYGLDLSKPQIGTEANSIGGRARYYAWYSPANNGDCDGTCLVVLRNPVRPGDHLAATATVRGPDRDHFTLTLTDVRYRKHQSPLKWTRIIHINNNAEPDSVSVGIGPSNTSRLADFRTVTFTNTQVNGHLLGSFEPSISQDNYIRYVDGYTHTLATTSSLGHTGARFQITWRRSS